MMDQWRQFTMNTDHTPAVEVLRSRGEHLVADLIESLVDQRNEWKRKHDGLLAKGWVYRKPGKATRKPKDQA